MRWLMLILALIATNSYADPVVDRYINAVDQQSVRENQASAAVVSQVQGDIDGDGRNDYVVLYAIYGPTWRTFHIVAFSTRTGQTVKVDDVELNAANANGLVVRNRTIYFNVSQLGPNDARCCPSIRGHGELVVQGNKLVDK